MKSGTRAAAVSVLGALAWFGLWQLGPGTALGLRVSIARSGRGSSRGVDCKDLGLSTLARFEAEDSELVPRGGDARTVQLFGDDVRAGRIERWTSVVPVNAVIVRGGQREIVRSYPGATSGGPLVAPLREGAEGGAKEAGRSEALREVEFCSEGGRGSEKGGAPTTEPPLRATRGPSSPPPSSPSPGTVWWSGNGRNSIRECREGEDSFFHWVFTAGGGEAISQVVLYVNGAPYPMSPKGTKEAHGTRMLRGRIPAP